MILSINKLDSGVYIKVRPFLFEREVGNLKDFEKLSTEKFPIQIDMTNRLPNSVTISSVTLAAVDQSTNLDVSNTVLDSTTGTISGNIVKGICKSGTNNKDYEITFTITLSDASILVEQVLMKVREELD